MMGDPKPTMWDWFWRLWRGLRATVFIVRHRCAQWRREHIGVTPAEYAVEEGWGRERLEDMEWWADRHESDTDAARHKEAQGDYEGLARERHLQREGD